MAFRNGLQYRHSDFKKFTCDDLAGSSLRRVNSVNFGLVTVEFNIAKRVQSLVSFFKTNISDKLSRAPPERFSPSFHPVVGI